MRRSKLVHGVVAMLVASAVSAGVWFLNGHLPLPAVLLLAVLGLAYWWWKPDALF